jgi:hypothetical protein
MFEDAGAFRVLNMSPVGLSVLLLPVLAIVIPVVLSSSKVFAGAFSF